MLRRFRRERRDEQFFSFLDTLIDITKIHHIVKKKDMVTDLVWAPGARQKSSFLLRFSILTLTDLS